jgi:hypothetical protein
MVARPTLAFRSFRTILGAGLLPTINSECIERTTNNMVTNTRQVFHTTASDENDGVLLEVMTFTTNIGDNFLPVRETNLCHLPES